MVGVCMIPKRCSCSQATQWNYVPTFDQFQNEGITLEVIDEVMSYLMLYDEETVNQTCEGCIFFFFLFSLFAFKKFFFFAFLVLCKTQGNKK